MAIAKLLSRVSMPVGVEFTRSILLAAMTAGACFGTGAASAQVCFNGNHGSANFGPQSSCPTTAEQEIFLVDAKNSMTSGEASEQTMGRLMSCSLQPLRWILPTETEQ
jgi:hypothetical protein